MAKYVTGTKSSTPISNISYVSESELKEQIDTLKGLYDVDVVYICHKGEFGKKDHIHYLIKSNGTQLSNVPNIMKVMYNYDVNGNKEKSRLFSQCKSLGDYYLYSLHNKPYLDAKGEVKEFYDYAHEEFKGDQDLINACVLASEELGNDKSTLANIVEMARNGATDLEILSEYKDILNITDLSHAIRSIRGVKELVQEEHSYNTFFRECYGFACEYLRKGDKVALDTLEFVEKECVLSEASKGIKLFELFLDKITRFDLIELLK